ncbi:MAG: SBBP repeat-containing protein [Sphingobacteriaceae bacterium]|nr:SBBP repeat-containing protein [Sphingobacteriaceae bacterium]
MPKKIHNFSLSLSLLIINLFSFSQPPSFNWAHGFGAGGTNVSNSITHDSFGNLITTGSFSGTVDFDPGIGTYTLSTLSTNAIYVHKLDANGNLNWAIKLEGNGTGEGNCVQTDHSSNVYVCGYFTGTADFDPGPGTTNLTALGNQDVFVCKFNSTGNLVWARQLGGPADEVGQGLTVDNLGNVYTTGFTQGAGDYDPGPGTFIINPIGSADVFINKLDNNGNFVWAKQFGGDNTGSGKTISYDASNNIFIGGFFSGNIDMDPNAGVYNLTSDGSTDIFITKLSASGSFIWANKMGGTFSDYCNSLVVDQFSNVYSTGAFQSTSDFDPGPGIANLTSLGINDVFISKLNANGTYAWAKKVGNTNDDIGNTIYLDTSENVITIGSFQSSVDFDPGPPVSNLVASGSNDVFILKLNSTGDYIWSLKFGGTDSDIGKSLTVDTLNNIISSGYFGGTANFNPGPGTFTVIAGGYNDYFIQKLCAIPATPINTTSPAFQNVCNGQSATLSVIGSGMINWYSSPNGTISIGTGTTFITPTLSLGTYNFYAEAFTCAKSPTRTVIGVSVTPLPAFSVSTSIALICAGETATLYASGITNCTWSPGNLTGTAVAVSPGVSTTYTAFGSNGGCVKTVTITQSVSPCTFLPLNNNENNVISVYPNPASEYLYIDADEVKSISVLDLLGKSIYSKNTWKEQHNSKERNKEINIQNWPPGIYFLKIETQDQIRLIKFYKL